MSYFDRLQAKLTQLNEETTKKDNDYIRLETALKKLKYKEDYLQLQEIFIKESDILEDRLDEAEQELEKWTALADEMMSRAEVVQKDARELSGIGRGVIDWRKSVELRIDADVEQKKGKFIQINRELLEWVEATKYCHYVPYMKSNYDDLQTGSKSASAWKNWWRSMNNNSRHTNATTRVFFKDEYKVWMNKAKNTSIEGDFKFPPPQQVIQNRNRLASNIKSNINNFFNRLEA